MINPTETRQLYDVEPGHYIEVLEVCGHPAFRKRMLSLGVTPNSRLKILRKMPAGGPIEIEIRGSRLAIRKTDAAQINIRISKKPHSASNVSSGVKGAFA